ncbi:GTPase-activating protein [Martiniozyma asiatica (nom. inval.)]|nr:GTPase-activating protein [Martiniozyma asiatica]
MKKHGRLKIDFSKAKSRVSHQTNELTLTVGQKIDIPSTRARMGSIADTQSTITTSSKVSSLKSPTRPRKNTTLSKGLSLVDTDLLSPSEDETKDVAKLRSQSMNEPIQLSVKFHESRLSSDLVLLDSRLIPGSKVGDVCEIECTNVSKKKLLFVIKEVDQESENSSVGTRFVSNKTISNSNFSSNFISILSGPMVSTLDLKPRSQVFVRLLDVDKIELDTVEIFVKDIHLSRGDMWNISNNLVKSALYRDQKLNFLKGSIRLSVNKLYKNGRKVFSGYVGKNTKVVYRSESARLIVFIQISSEMWHFEESGQQMFHKLVNSLFPKAFQRWKEMGTHHLITIVLFSSIDIDGKGSSYSPGEIPVTKKDYYRVVVDQVSILLWNEIMAKLRLEFANFKRDILLQKNENLNEEKPQEFLIEGRVLPAVKSNFLEAVSLGISLVADDFKDPELRQTTNHFIVITPGTGIFDVSYDMLIRTSKLLYTVDSTIDIICLSQPPLHVVPLLRYLDNQNKLKHCIPTWLDISFWSDSSQAVHQWLPKCKIYDLQMMGVMENELAGISVNELDLSHERCVLDAMNAYDRAAFKSPLDISTAQNLRDSKRVTISETVIKDTGVKRGITILHHQSSRGDQIADADGLNPTQLMTKKTSSPTTSNAVGVTTTSKSNVSAFSSLLSLSKQTESQPVTSSAYKFVRKMMSTPILKPLSPNSESAEDDNKIDAITLSSSRQSSLDTITSLPRQLSTTTITSNEMKKTSSMKSNISRKKTAKKTEMKEKKKDTGSFNGYWTNIENPSKTLINEIQSAMSYGRWKYAFPPKIRRRTVKWTSLSTPASLPITTPLFPSVQDFNQNFTFRIYDVFLNQNVVNENHTSKTLMRNMISLRLSLGFQICTGGNVIKIENQRKPNGDSKMLVQYIDENNYLGARIYLILGNEIHRLCCDFNGLINVQVYKRITSTDELATMNKEKKYVEHIRTRYAESYQPVTITKSSTDMRNYNWNLIDQAVAGYDDSVDRKRYHRLKFVILPTKVPENSYSVSNEKLSPEEIRLEGIRSLIMSIYKVRFRTPEEKKAKKKSEITPEINFYTGSLFKFLRYAYHSFTNEQKFNSIMFVTPQYSTTINLYKLAAILQTDKGIQIMDRLWHMRLHQHCFLGSDLVSWLIENFDDIDTRDEAVEFGNSLMEQKLFSHVVSTHRFLDGHYFYSLNKEFVSSSSKVEAALKKLNEELNERRQNSRKQSVASGKEIESVYSNPAVSNVKNEIKERSESNVPSILGFKTQNSLSNKAEGKSTINSSRSTSINIETLADVSSTNANQSNKTVILSRELLCDLDPDGVSWQPELINVHYDIVHNPEHCFHIRLEWLTTTSKLIEDIVNGWGKHCERYGLSLVEVPWEELFTLPQRNPLHSTVDISMGLNPWTDTEFKDYQDIFNEEKYYFHLYLLEKCDFMLDNRTANYFKDHSFDVTYSWGRPQFKYAQFIHSTGAYIAELRQNGDFFLAPNNSHITRLNLNIEQTHLSSEGAVYFDSQKVMLEFTSICNDEEQLRLIFREAVQVFEESSNAVEDLLKS